METRHPLDVSRIESWHAHVYFDAATRDAAWTFRDVLAKALGERVAIGRFHERPVGPHPKWSYQVAFHPQQFAEVVRNVRRTVLRSVRTTSVLSLHRTDSK
jgi:aromatic ring-cleaving dioxygenase